jgi:hypothetical protein
MGEQAQSKNGNQSHHTEINIFNESGTIAEKRICHEAQAGELCGMRLV